MKKLLLAGVLLYSSMLCRAQEDTSAAINAAWTSYAGDSNLTLQQIVRTCDSQFTAAGYGNSEIDDSGKDEDGSGYASYQRWKNFWMSRYNVSNGKLHDFSKDAVARLTGGLPATNCGGTSSLQSSLSPTPAVAKGWEFIGPQNITAVVDPVEPQDSGEHYGNYMHQHLGQVNEIIVNPANTFEIYATDAFGGLWKTNNANLAPNNTWTCLSDHLPSMAGIGVSNLYVDFSTIPHRLFCLASTPHSIALGNSLRTAGIFYSTDDGATFNQMNISTAIADVSSDPILDMKYWTGNPGSSTKYLFICTRLKIYRLDITNPASISSTVMKDVTSLIPTDNTSGRFGGFKGISFLASDPTVMYISTPSNYGNGLPVSAGLYKISGCNTCSSCTLTSITGSSGFTAMDYYNGAGFFSTGLPDGWIISSDWQRSVANANVFLSPSSMTKTVASIEAPVAGSYLDNMSYTITFNLTLPANTEVDVILKDVISSNEYGADWSGSSTSPTPGAIGPDYPVGNGSSPSGTPTAGHYIGPLTNYPVTVTINTTHFVDRLEFAGYKLPTYTTGTDNIILDNVQVLQSYENFVENVTSSLANPGYLYCVTNNGLNATEWDHTLRKIQDGGSTFTVSSYALPKYINQFQISTVNSNILYGCSTNDQDMYKIDIGGSTPVMTNSTKKVNQLHTDTRSIVLLPSGTDDAIYIGDDGGIALGSFSGDWTNLNGTGMKTLLGFDIGSSIHTGEIGIAATDNGIIVCDDQNFNHWFFFYVGDGGQVKYGKRYLTRNIRFTGSSGSSGFESLDLIQTLGVVPSISLTGGAKVSAPPLAKLVATRNDEYVGTGFPIGQNKIYDVEATLSAGSYALLATPISTDATYIDPDPVQALAPDQYDPTFLAAYLQSAPWNPSSFAVSSNINSTRTWNITPNTSGAAFICMVADPRSSYPNKKMWAGASGYGTAETKRVMQTTNAGSSWTDMSHGLPAGPVNALVYDEQSHYLFAGTDQGVYAFNVDNGANSASNPWVCYSLSLPNSFVTGLDINRCTGKIYVSMYGRGAYQAELPLDPNATGSYTTGGANGINDVCDIDKIASTTTWTQDVDETRSIYIPAGVTLTIQNCTINMGRDKSIIVAPKGKLIVDNATITNSCGYMWKGIEARGDISKAQYASNQSTVIIKNNSLIQYAQTGIANWNISGSDYNSTGGIIQVSNSTFNDNHIAASFAPYRGTYLSIPQKDFSYFARTNFTIDSNYRDYNGAYPFQEHVAILQDDGVTFTGCNFSNTKNSGDGIYVMDAGVYVLPYYAPGDYSRLYPIHSQFSGFDRGVDIESSKGLSPLASVDYTDFSACGIGVFVSAINDVSITRSSFNIGQGPKISQVSGDPCSQNIGIYMKNASPFQIEQNTFTGIPSSSINNYGAVVENAKYYYDNKVYRCTFGSLNYGCVAVGNNGAGTNPGLHILCNSFNNNTTDIGLEPLASIPTQGSITTGTGNTFTSGGGTIVNNGSSFWYYNYGANSLPATISPLYSVSFTTANAANTCASTFGDPAFPTKLTSSRLNSIKAGFKNVKPAWQNYASQYNSLMDGGCTTCRVNQIQGNTQGIYNTLMAEAPYLSSTVLSTAGSANHFSYSQYYNLLYACPEALRDNDLMTFIQYSIPNPISQQDIAALRQRANTNTARTTLESEIYDTHTAMSQDALSIIQALKVNTDTTWLALDSNSNNAQYDSTSAYSGIDSVGVWLQNIGDLSSQYQLVGYYLAMGNISAASSALSSVPNMFQLSTDETAEYNRYNTVLNILINMKNSGRNLAQLTSTELNSINVIGANSATDDAQIIAADIINFGGGIGFPLPPNRYYPIPCLPLMWTSGKPEATIASSNMKEYNRVEAYPNPARDNVTFKYDIAKINGKAHLTITDVVGTLKADIPVDNVHGYIDWSTEKLSPGVYIYKLSDASKTIGTGKLTIIK